MKRFLYFLILSLFCLNLKAQGIGEWRPDGFHMNAGLEPVTDLNKAKELWKTYGTKIDTKEFQEKINYMYSSSVERAPCLSCPEYLKLSQAVNKAIKEMPIADVTEANLVTIRSNELEFMYAVNRFERGDGRVDCKKYFETHAFRDLYEGKKEGSYRVLTSTIAEMTGVGSVQFLDKELSDVYYYYRGTDDKKNFIYEVRSKKNQPYVITIYEYLPTEKEKNPYNLPDLGSTAPEKKRVKKEPEVEEISTADMSDPNYMNFEFRLEKKGKYLPKDLHLFNAGTEASLLDLAKVKSSTKLSIKDRSTKLSLTPMEGSDEYLRLEVRHKGIDEVGTKVIIPYKIELDAAGGRSLIGAVSEEVIREGGRIDSEQSNQTLSLILTDHDLEFLRLDARKSRDGNSMVTLGHARKMSPNESFAISGGYREDNASNGGAAFIGVQHAKRIKEATTMVLDLKYDTQNKTTIMWQVQHKF